MDSETRISWQRNTIFDPMTAHSQADDPALAHVVQFNADEREHQERLFQKLARAVSGDQKRSHGFRNF
jgi:hypothetical protein